MAIGKAIGTYTATATSLTKSTDVAGNHHFVLNLEGTTNGAFDGVLIGTMTNTTPGAGEMRSGRYASDFCVFLGDGSVVTLLGSGVLGLNGSHQWFATGTLSASNGANFAVDGVLDLASRSLSGSVYEII